ncbi:Transmembrane_domain-containing protein [Hexamita inflata]|uniref:Transmembrane domain-containing protein n=1 Tax=Hexamita inflata TaxID=28002 RepID=A0AA86QX16_9EUKA|nr:Transmembrane domain-containing protein [Hexamita inflata]CAI9962841.1 Transmembrane domain-containing protein [Hexamita inflata]CAI9970531.1 Transmembrane domain-containing protein [Hexamita inflata]
MQLRDINELKLQQQNYTTQIVQKPHRNPQFEKEVVTCSQVYSQCKAPEFKYCQSICSIFTCCCGCGLQWCCCYGFHRIDCISVCCAGTWMEFTSPCIYGELVACIVGFRMLKK